MFITSRRHSSAAILVLFLLTDQKMDFFGAEETTYKSNKRKCSTAEQTAHPLMRTKFHVDCSKMYGYKYKNVKISNFGNKFLRHTRLVFDIFRKFSAFVCVYIFIHLLHKIQTTKRSYK